MAPKYLPVDRRSWLLAIGSRLRAEYDAVAEPVPDRLAALIAQLEAPPAASQGGTQAAAAAPTPDKTPEGTPPPLPRGAILECRAGY
jgi:Anti-sigma factor NepR